MGTRATLAVAAVSAIALTAAITVASAASSTDPKLAAGTGSCTTDSRGICTLSHTLDSVPETIVVSPVAPQPSAGFLLNTVRGSYTAKDFKVRALSNRSTPLANSAISVSWIAYAIGITPPPSTSSTTPAPPPITTVVPPTTSTTTSPPTTTPAPAGTCPGGVKPTTFAEQDGGDFPIPATEGSTSAGSSYFVFNNAWNWQGGSQHETLDACSASNWWVDSYGFTPNNGEVYMYPDVHLDIPSATDQMGGKPLSTWPTAITGRFAGKGPGAGSYDVAWDLWLNGVADKNSFELMVWTEAHGAAEPAGNKIASYTDASTGQVYDVWWDGTHTDQAYLAYVSQKTQLSGTVDLRAMIVNAQKQGYLPPGNTTVNQINYGDEVRDTQGATSANPYRFTVSDFGIVMK